MVTPTGNQQNNCDGMLDSQSLFSLIDITLIFFTYSTQNCLMKVEGILIENQTRK